jgi:hypothetical protein
MRSMIKAAMVALAAASTVLVLPEHRPPPARSKVDPVIGLSDL